MLADLTLLVVVVADTEHLRRFQDYLRPVSQRSGQRQLRRRLLPLLLQGLSGRADSSQLYRDLPIERSVLVDWDSCQGPVDRVAWVVCLGQVGPVVASAGYPGRVVPVVWVDYPDPVAPVVQQVALVVRMVMLPAFAQLCVS